MANIKEDLLDGTNRIVHAVDSVAHLSVINSEVV